MSNPLFNLNQLGTSVWYDNISRGLLHTGGLQELVDVYAVRGVTSNPTIFANALKSGTSYDQQIKDLSQSKLELDRLFEELACFDIALAADILRPVYDATNGVDGYVSIEVSPLLACDTQATIEEAKHLFARLNRPNIMIKIPGTAEGIPAIRAVLEEGINVNVTLLFSVENYMQVAECYITALENRERRGLPIKDIASVASFFVSRVDTLIDSILANNVKLNRHVDESSLLFGKFGIANSKLAYQEFKRIFSSETFKRLATKGARVQRPLWASTSTKNPDYRDVIYVEELIGPNTVNTMPDNTLRAFAQHGEAKVTMEKDIEECQGLASRLAKVGVDVNQLLQQLQIEGVQKFTDSFIELRDTLAAKL